MLNWRLNTFHYKALYLKELVERSWPSMHHHYWFCSLSRFQLTGCGSYKVDINSFNICLKLWILVQTLLLFTPT